MAVDYSAFEGWPIEGRPSLVTVRGEVQAREEKFVGGLRSSCRAPRRISRIALDCRLSPTECLELG
jgi:hypothetical protein